MLSSSQVCTLTTGTKGDGLDNDLSMLSSSQVCTLTPGTISDGLDNDLSMLSSSQVCTLTPGTIGDGIDNDCDGLTDEEYCYSNDTPGNIDYDIDGDFNEDCSKQGGSKLITEILVHAFLPEHWEMPAA